ncbi:YceI family protein [Lacimicrobium sp. SS2-24]|uniref:YceI family protein n=1 Tax=Lacimicrobium sp. SS2-24 TaxID=2005569 RepID=UPI000B4B55E6|nr:YceI family protein [Lacimicrobium sp. SS2-24]
MKKLSLSLITLAAMSAPTFAADYIIDSKGAHAAINFKIQHLGYSWLTGRFNTFDGNFSYDADNPQASSITVNIDPASIDSNHAERDKHLRNEDFLHVTKFDKARFVSTKVTDVEEDGDFHLHGDLTLHGVTKPVVIDVEKIGEGEDPWGGYRVGFAGETKIALKDYGIDYDLGPASTHVLLELHIEGVRQ